jgi:hypothetical protein
MRIPRRRAPQEVPYVLIMALREAARQYLRDKGVPEDVIEAKTRHWEATP